MNGPVVTGSEAPSAREGRVARMGAVERSLRAVRRVSLILGSTLSRDRFGSTNFSDGPKDLQDAIS